MDWGHTVSTSRWRSGERMGVGTGGGGRFYLGLHKYLTHVCMHTHVWMHVPVCTRTA